MSASQGVLASTRPRPGAKGGGLLTNQLVIYAMRMIRIRII